MASSRRSRELKIAVAFGAKTREVRLDQGLTQEAVAEAAGLHPTFVSNIERGYRVPTLPTVLKIAAALGVRPGQLIDDLA